MAGYDVFGLNKYSYTNSLAQVLEMMNQYENRAVQRENIASQDRGNALNYDAKMQGLQAEQQQSALRMMQDQQQFEANQGLAQQKLGLDVNKAAEDQRHNLAGEAISQQKADADSQYKMGQLWDIGQKNSRENEKHSMDKMDWLDKQAAKETLSKALNTGGVEEYTKALGQLGMTKEFTDMNNFLEARNRNAYLNQKDYISSIKEGTEFEVGQRVREGYNIGMQYAITAQKDKDLADQQLPKALAASTYYKDMANMPIETLRVAFPSSFLADGQSIGKNASDPNFARLGSNLIYAFTGAKPGVLNIQEPTSAMQNIAAANEAEAQGNTRDASLLRGAAKGAPVVSIGPNGEEVSKGTQPNVTDWQKKAVYSQKTSQQLDSIIANLEIPENQDLLTRQGKFLTDVATGKASIGQANPEDKQRIAAVERLINPMLRSLQDYVLQQAGTTFTDNLIKTLEEQWISGKIDPITALERAKVIKENIDKDTGYWKEQLSNGGVQVEQNQNAQQKATPSREDLYAMEQKATAAGDEEMASRIRTEILKMEMPGRY